MGFINILRVRLTLLEHFVCVFVAAVCLDSKASVLLASAAASQALHAKPE